MIKKFIVFVTLLLFGVILPVVTADAYMNYPIKNEFEDFMAFVENYVDSSEDRAFVYPQSLTETSYIRYVSDVTYPTGTTYQNCKVEITIDEISLDVIYALSGIDTNIRLDFVLYSAIHLYYYDYSSGISNYTTEYFEFALPSYELDLTPYQLVREGIPSHLSELDFQTAFSIILVNFVSDVTPYSTNANLGLQIVTSFNDSNIEDYNTFLFRDIFNPTVYSNFSNRLSRLGISPNYTSSDDRNIILTENLRVEIPNFLYTYTLAENYGGVKVLNPLEEVSFVDWLINAIGGFMDFEIAPGMSLSNILMFILMIAIVLIFLKLFAGG